MKSADQDGAEERNILQGRLPYEASTPEFQQVTLDSLSDQIDLASGVPQPGEWVNKMIMPWKPRTVEYVRKQLPALRSYIVGRTMLAEADVLPLRRGRAAHNRPAPSGD
jgi:hypothetical protein